MHRIYLLLLAMGQHKVEHFKTNVFYQCILEGKPNEKRRMRYGTRRFAFVAQAEDEWDLQDQEVELVPPRKKAARGSPARAQPQPSTRTRLPLASTATECSAVLTGSPSAFEYSGMFLRWSFGVSQPYC